MASLTERADGIEGLSDMLESLANGSEKSAAMLAGLESMNDADHMAATSPASSHRLYCPWMLWSAASYAASYSSQSDCSTPEY